MKKEIKKWVKKIFYSIKNTKLKLLEKMKDIDMIEEDRSLTDEQRRQRNHVERELNEILKHEETLWKQRSITYWLKEVEFNTAYFHKVANGKLRVNNISNIVQNGEDITSQEE